MTERPIPIPFLHPFISLCIATDWWVRRLTYEQRLMWRALGLAQSA